MNERKRNKLRLILFALSPIVVVFGIAVIENIDIIMEGQRWSLTILVGLAIGALPIILGVCIFTAILVELIANQWARRNK